MKLALQVLMAAAAFALLAVHYAMPGPLLALLR